MLKESNSQGIGDSIQCRSLGERKTSYWENNGAPNMDKIVKGSTERKSFRERIMNVISNMLNSWC